MERVLIAGLVLGQLTSLCASTQSLESALIKIEAFRNQQSKKLKIWEMVRSGQQVYSIGDFVVNVANREIMAKGNEIKVQRRVFDLLVYLIENRDRTIDKEELLDEVWEGRITTDAALARVIMKARKLFGDDAKKQKVIKTLHGQGYRFVAHVEPIESPNEVPTDLDNGLPRYERKSVIRFALILVFIPIAWLIWHILTAIWTPSAPDELDARISVQPWRQADMLFQRDVNWRGADGPISVDLGAGKIVWFFGASQIAKSPTFERRDLTLIANSVAVQSGYDPTAARIEFFWGSEGGEPSSFFPESNGLWYWPVNAIFFDQKILVLLQETEHSNEGLGFRATRIVARVITNPLDSPPNWKTYDLDVPENDVGVLFGLELIRDGDHVLAFGSQDSTDDVYLARWITEEMNEEDELQIEWWCGNGCGWTPHTNALLSARPVLSDTHIWFSVRFSQELNKYLLLGSWGFPSAVFTVQTSDSLHGPWSQRRTIYRPEEENLQGMSAYGIKIQNGLHGSDFVATYNVSNENLSSPQTDNNIDFPRFIKIETN